jgi:hypothetical protein
MLKKQIRRGNMMDGQFQHLDLSIVGKTISWGPQTYKELNNEKKKIKV